MIFHTNRKLGNAGFSLVEIAIVLLVISIVAGSAITAFRVQVNATHVAQAQEQIREAREALLSFAMANQRLPCPASDISGVEKCPSPPSKGLLPWQTLGLQSTDPWGQVLHYAVSANFASPGFGLNTAGSLRVFEGATDIDNPGGTKAVAFVVWSSGEDVADASANSAAMLDTDVLAANPGSDDLVEWVSRYVLFGKMMAAGRPIPLNAAASAASSSAASSASSSASSASSS